MNSLKRLWRASMAFVRPPRHDYVLMSGNVIRANPRHIERLTPAVEQLGGQFHLVADPYVPASRRMGRREAARAAWKGGARWIV